VAIIETRKHVGITVIQSFDACITTIRMETVVTPSINVIRSGVLIGSITKLVSGSSGVLIVWNLNYQQLLLELLAHLKWCLLIL
jgi:hypothetical protein